MKLIFLIVVIQLAIGSRIMKDGRVGQDVPMTTWKDKCKKDDPNIINNAYCDVIAENNYCDDENFIGKCCKSCRKFDEEKDPYCYDQMKGCKHYKSLYGSSAFQSVCAKTCKFC